MKVVNLLLVLCLTGCGATIPKVVVPPEKTYVLPEITPCQDTLPKIKGLTNKDLIRNSEESTIVYKDCKDKHNDVIEWFKRNFPLQFSK